MAACSPFACWTAEHVATCAAHAAPGAAAAVQGTAGRAMLLGSHVVDFYVRLLAASASLLGLNSDTV